MQTELSKIIKKSNNGFFYALIYLLRNPSYVEWASSFIALIVDLSEYVKKWHTTGLTWNPKGGDVSSGIVVVIPHD